MDRGLCERGVILVMVCRVRGGATRGAEPLVKLGSAAASIMGLWRPHEVGVMCDAVH
jgi:hypothetical protein